MDHEFCSYILKCEDNSRRFEKFCVELLSTAEGILYVVTAQSWDKGQDGTSLGTEAGKFLIQSSIEKNIDKKIKEEKNNISKMTCTRLSICFNTSISVHVKDRISLELRNTNNKITYVIYGLDELSTIASRHEAIVKKYYNDIILNHDSSNVSTLLVHRADQLKGLRIALTIQLDSDSQLRKTEITKSLVLNSLYYTGTPISKGLLIAKITQFLRLSKNLNDSYISPVLASLLTDDFVTLTNSKYSITKKGKEHVDDITRLAESKLTIGEQEIHKLLEQLTGYNIINDEWNMIWRIIGDGIAELFHSNGGSIVTSIANLLSQEQTVTEEGSLINHVNDISQRIKTIQGGGPRLDDISTAFLDMFMKKDSDAFKWLVELCSLYIDMCSLGIEPTSQEQIAKVLKNTSIILDTDVILTLLSEGEPNHNSVVVFVQTWKKNGGTLLVPMVVLEEVAYHVWIAEREYESVKNKIHAIEDNEAMQILDNVFVRGFKALCKLNNTTDASWTHYIQAFRGKTQYDYSKILNLLNVDYGISQLVCTLPNQSSCDSITQVLVNAENNRKDNFQALLEKSKRDAVIALQVSSLTRQSQSVESAFRIVSSSSALRRAVAMAMDTTNPNSFVLYISALGWLTTLLPGASFTIGTLKGLLFDISLRQKLPAFDHSILKILSNSKEFQLHWSRRGTLLNAVHDKIAVLANERNITQEQVQEELLDGSPEHSLEFAKVIVDSVDKISTSQSERKIYTLNQRIELLEKKLTEANAKLKDK